jgi:hypothetical protein
MIGKLGRLIKSKKHPVATLAKRYQLNISAVAHAPAEAMDEDDPTQRDPILNKAALNSFTKANRVVWPKWTPWNSAKHPLNGHQEHARQRVLEPILGKAECDRHVNEPTEFKMFFMHTRVQVGIHNYNSKRNEDRKLTEKTRESYFRLLAKDVPLMVEQYADEVASAPDATLYGRILNFAQLKVAWRPELYLLAEVCLFRALQESEDDHPEPTTRLPFIDLEDRMEFSSGSQHVYDRHGHIVRTTRRMIPCFVQAETLRGMIGLGPKGETEYHFYVLSLD